MAFEFYFDESFKWAALYLAKGLRVIRLHGIRPNGHCTCGDEECRVGGTKQKSAGKHPVGSDWGERYARSEDDLLDWDDGTPFNIGVLLGPEGGVIDNEDDSPEATSFRESLGLSDFVTPSWTSGKSTHQLTKWDDRLSSCPGVVKPGGLECRLGSGGRQIQSVLPPSWHNTGVQYQWKPGLSIDDTEIAETPKALLVQIVNGGGSLTTSGKPSEYVGPLVFRKVHDGEGRHRALLLWSWQKIVKTLDPMSSENRAVITQEVLDANEKYLSPPKSAGDVLQIVNSCFEHYRRRQDAGWTAAPSDTKEGAILKEADEVAKSVNPEDSVAVVGFEAHGLVPYQVGSVTGYRPGNWKVEMLQGDPPEIVLCVPQWTATPCQGRIHMSLDTFRSAPKVASAVFNATRKVILDGDSKKWFGVWKGLDAGKKTGGVSVPGLLEQLMAKKTTADDIPVGTSGQRYAVLAGYILAQFKKAKSPKDELKPEPNESGRACWVTPDELWFQWMTLWEEIGRTHEIEQGERNRMRNRILTAMSEKDFKHKRHRFPGIGRLEYVVFTREWIEAVERMAAGVDGESPIYGGFESDFAKTKNHEPSTVHRLQVVET